MEKERKEIQKMDMEVLEDELLDDVSGGKISLKNFEKKVDKDGHVVHGKYDQYLHED